MRTPGKCLGARGKYRTGSERLARPLAEGVPHPLTILITGHILIEASTTCSLGLSDATIHVCSALARTHQTVEQVIVKLCSCRRSGSHTGVYACLIRTGVGANQHDQTGSVRRGETGRYFIWTEFTATLSQACLIFGSAIATVGLLTIDQVQGCLSRIGVRSSTSFLACGVFLTASLNTGDE